MHDKLHDSEDEDFYSATSRGENGSVSEDSEVTTPDPLDADLLDEVGDVFEDCEESSRLCPLEPIPETKPLEISPSPPRDCSPCRKDKTPSPVTFTSRRDKSPSPVASTDLCGVVEKVHIEADEIIMTDKNVARTFVNTSAVLRTVPCVETQS
jgi:hypothetical protein